MIPDMRTRAGIRAGDAGRIQKTRRPRRSTVPLLEPLESRRLLSVYSGPSANLPVSSRAGAFLVQVSGGPGVVKVRSAANGTIDLTAYGTTSATTITITQTQPRFHFRNQLLMIQNLFVRSGQLAGLEALPAELTGRMTPLTNSVNTFDIGALGPKAQVNISGSVAEMTVSNINLGPTGHLSIAEGINAAPTSPTQSGLLTIGEVTIGSMNLNGGRFLIGGDSALPITIQGNLTISQDGLFSIGRDLDDLLTVDGSVSLNAGGQILVGRNLNNFTVEGNFIVGPGGSGMAVKGALNGLNVDGYFQGQGGTNNTSAIDVGVGLNLTGLTILGGVSGQGGLINANIRAGGSVSGVNIPYGTDNSLIQANAAMAS